MESSSLFIASDHAGFALKSKILSKHADGLQIGSPALHWRLIDLGPSTDDRVDYPDFANSLVEKVLADPLARGVLICGSGQGMAMAANRHRGIRAAVTWDERSTELARSHNDANVLCLGARLLSDDRVEKMLTVFLQTPFEGGRHVGRIVKLDAR